eukprot:scaffold65099_cov68-Attheya_sp.AAC.5
MTPPFYNVTVVDGGHIIQHVGSDAPPCILLSTRQRCNYASVEAFNEFQCPHKNARDKKFCKELLIYFGTSWPKSDIPCQTESWMNKNTTPMICSDSEGCHLSQSMSGFSQQRDG